MAKQAHTDERTALMVGHQHYGAWAIDASFRLQSFLQDIDSKPAPRATWKRDVKASLSFPAYANEDGSNVSALDTEADARIMDGAVCIIPIKGVMMREARDYMAFYGVSSTERLTQYVEQAMNDSRIKAIVLTGFSVGGQVAGSERFAAAVAKAKEVKPVIGHIERAYSACYWAMANCSELYIDGATASAGSIGIMATLSADTEEWLKAMGINLQEVYADGSEDKNRAENEALQGKHARLKNEELNPLREAFANTVREARGAKLKASKDNDPLKGRTYTGQEVVDCGLADGFATLQECISKARGTGSNSNPDNPTAMAKTWKEIGAFAKELLGFKQPTTEPNAEQLAEANAALKEQGIEGMVFASATQVKDLAAVATLRTELESANTAKATAETARTNAEAKVRELEAKVNAAVVAGKLTVKEGESPLDTVLNATAEANKVIAASIDKNKLTIAEGKTAAETLAAAADEWGGKGASAHSGGQKSGDQKPAKELYSSLAAAEAAGIPVDGDEK